jgi:L-lactate dehydrogenase complex protein LldG
LKELGANKGYLDPKLSAHSLEESFTVERRFNREEVDTYDFGITRATGAIAETGTIVLSDGDTPNRLSALAPWIHVAALNSKTIQATLSDAIPTFGNDPSIVMVTDPSKTADIEGILIEGVHGPGVQICLLV